MINNPLSCIRTFSVLLSNYNLFYTPVLICMVALGWRFIHYFEQFPLLDKQCHHLFIWIELCTLRHSVSIESGVVLLTETLTCSFMTPYYVYSEGKSILIWYFRTLGGSILTRSIVSCWRSSAHALVTENNVFTV